MTQEDVAFAAGLPTATVSKIERCVLSPTLRTIEKLADGLDVPICEFFPVTSDDEDEDEVVVEPPKRDRSATRRRPPPSYRLL